MRTGTLLTVMWTVFAAVWWSSSSDTPRPASVVISNAASMGTQSQLVDLDWALGRFESAGLELPPLEVRFHSEPAGCGGYAGLNTTLGGVQRIDICRDSRFVILHELAHAWEAPGLSPRLRADFLAMRRLQVWNDPAFEWSARGTEHSASIIAWGLSRLGLPPVGILPNDTDSLAEAFRLLTGRGPLHRDETPIFAGGVAPRALSSLLVDVAGSRSADLPAATDALAAGP